MSDNKSIITPFCEFLEEDHSQNPSPLIGLIKKLKKLYHKTKADLSLNFSSYPHHVDDEYLDYFINELHSYYQIQEVNLSDIEEWLKKYNLKIDDIEKYKYPKLIKYFFELPYEPQNYTGDSSDIHNIRKALILYFKDKFTQEMLDFLESKKKSTQIENGTAENFTSEEVVYAIIENYKNLKALNEKIANEFQSSGDFSEDNYTEIQFRYDLDQNAISWTIQKLLDKLYIQSAKDNYYYFDCPAKVYTGNYKERLLQYQEYSVDGDEEDFLVYEVEYLTTPFNQRFFEQNNSKYWYNDLIEYEEKYKVSIRKKLQFLSEKLKKYGKYIEIIEDTTLRDPKTNGYKAIGTDAVIRNIEKANDIIGNKETFVESKETPKTNTIKTNQLTANQIVLLLEELGFFTDTKIKNFPNTKKAELISIITGYNKKNIKTRIESLEKNPSTLGDNYQSDQHKIQQILNNLE